jgi:inner membrane protein
MANYQGHLVAGAITGGSVDVIRKIIEKKPLELRDIILLSLQVCVGSVGGVLPDRLEPAIHPHHRKFFHSILFLSLIGVGLFLLWDNKGIADWIKWLLTALAVAFIIHLIIDGFTPAGLPVV